MGSLCYAQASRGLGVAWRETTPTEGMMNVCHGMAGPGTICQGRPSKSWDDLVWQTILGHARDVDMPGIAYNASADHGNAYMSCLGFRCKEMTRHTFGMSQHVTIMSRPRIKALRSSWQPSKACQALHKHKFYQAAHAAQLIILS